MCGPVSYTHLGTAIAVDRDNNVFSIGDFIGTKDFDPSGTVYNLTSSGSQDIYITKLDSNGEFLWAKNVGGKQTERALSICTDKLGDVYLSGTFYDLADFDPDPLVTVELKSPKSVSSFILKLNSWGNYKWARLLAVSYTHLDVYKRQVVTVGDHQLVKTVSWYDNETVSYTHLDVYKRQMSMSS